MPKPESTWKKLAAASAAARRSIARVLVDAERLASSKEVDAISACQALEIELAAWMDSGLSVASRAKQLLSRLEGDRRVQTEAFEQRLSRELTRSGHSVFGEKSLLVVDGIVHVHVEPSASRVHINDVPVDDLEVKAISQRVSDEVARLRRLITPPTDLLEGLLDAYEREIRASGAAMGSRVQTATLALQMTLQRQGPSFRADPAAKYYREYPRAQFRADLYTLLSSGQTNVKGCQFHFAPGADTSGAIFILVPALDRMAHVGRIWFDRSASARNDS